VNNSVESLSKPSDNWKRSVSRRWSQIRRAVSLDRIDKVDENKPTGGHDARNAENSVEISEGADRSTSNLSYASEEYTSRSPLRRTSSFRALINAFTPRSRRKFSTVADSTSKDHR